MNTSAHKFGFVGHMAIVKDQKSALEIAWRPSYDNLTTNKIKFGNTGGKWDTQMVVSRFPGRFPK